MNQVIEPRTVHLTTRSGISVRRTLPTNQVRMIGAWCFLDHYGPTSDAGSMSVAAHPHAGLQTVSWLFAGQLEHRDSLSSNQVIQPGELNLMTAGHGIAHSELSEASVTPLHGVQLWVALPDSDREQSAHFEHHADLPVVEFENGSARILVGDLFDHESPANVYSPLVGAEITIGKDSLRIPLRPDFEYGLLPVDSAITVNGNYVPAAHLLHMGSGATTAEISGRSGSRVMLIGGEPFGESIVMWWNFVARSHDDIVRMREDWEVGSDRFAEFTDRIGGRIPAPDLPNVSLRPRT